MAPSVTTDVPSWNRSNELDIEVFLVNFLGRRKDENVLRCPACGRGLVAVSAWKGYTRNDGTRRRHFYYACATGRRSGKEACSYGRTPNARKIEAEVWEAVKAVLLDPERLERGLDAYLETEMEKDGGPREGSPGVHEQDRRG
jgi:hypothetical protein